MVFLQGRAQGEVDDRGLDFAGELAESRMQPGDGNSTYSDRLIDAISNLDGASLDKGAKYELL